TGAVAVLDGDKLVGMFSERDVMDRIVSEQRDPRRTPISDVMTKNVKTIDDRTSVRDAVTLMREHRIRHLPVLDASGALKGMVALRYLLFDIVDDLERESISLRSYFGADGAGG